MSRKSKKTASLVATLIVVIAIIVAVVLAVQHYKDDIEEIVNPSFGVIYNDKTYRGKQNGVVLPENGQAVFSIKNVSTCTVKVVPNYDFIYTVNGAEHHFNEHEDLTSIFVRQTDVFADYFVINCTKDSFSPENVIKSFYESDAEVIIPEHGKIYPFRLVVTSNTGDEIWLQFGQGEGWLNDGMNPDHVVF